MVTMAGLAVGAALALPPSGGGVVRHALVVGANDGGQGLEPLRYAEDDARRVVDVLTELGGFESEQLTMLRSPDRRGLESALARHAALAAAHPQDLFLFYYSGHADAQGLRLGEERVPFAELRARIQALPAEIRLGVLDACRSGEITRLKGFQLDAPFATEETLSAEGEAWLTATAADEQAQESDRLQGSFFTHYLVSGLRGAADAQGGETGDGQVSLVEAYDYAFARTVARTGATDGGTQHPGYDFRLQGQGDLALTDVRRSSARIVIPVDMAGEFSVLRLPDERPVAELAKATGVPMSVALPPGRYRLRARGADGTSEATIGLAEGTTLRVREFRALEGDSGSAKGGVTDADLDVLPPIRPPAAPWQELPPLERLRQGMGELGTGWRQLRDGAADAVDEFSLGAAPDDADLPPHALALATEGMPTARRACPLTGPECLSALTTDHALPSEDAEVRVLHPDGTLAAVGRVQGGSATDTWVFFSPSGERVAAGRYVSGRQSGPWTWWWPDGTVRERGAFVDGERAGVWVEYHGNGRRKRRTTWSAGQAVGTERQWYESGRLRAAGEVVGRQHVGTWVYRHDNGRREARGRFTTDGRTGRWTTWHGNGRRASAGAYLLDEKDGRWTTWDASGQKRSRGRHDAGSRTGLWRTWHPDGHLETVGRYADGVPVGRWLRWDRSGTRKVGPGAEVAYGPEDDR